MLIKNLLYYLLLVLVVSVGCSGPGASDNRLAGDHESDSTTIVSPVKIEDDTLSYIGYIRKFDDNDLFCTDLYFVDHFDYGLYNDIAKMGGQVTFKDDETQRTKLDVEKVGQYFDLTGLKNIDIYDHQNKKLTSGRLSHIEYVEGVIEGSFVAVFQVDNPDISEPLFCVGNPDQELSVINFSHHQREELDSTLIDLLKLNAERVVRIEHYKLDDQTIYSTLSADTTAFIIETTNGNHKTLYKSKSSETISRLVMVSREINGRKILMTESGVPETDIMWNSVLVFNGTEYEMSHHQRVSHQRRK